MDPADVEVRKKIDDFQATLYRTDEPDRTLFEVIGRTTRERDWQALLAYFLRPANRHGFDRDILDTFLRTIEDHTDIRNFDGPLETVRVDVEVQTPSQKRVDLFLTQEGRWFLCVELKVQASEHTHQTPAYVDADYIGTRAKADYPSEHHHYLYLNADADDRPSSSRFEHLTWGVLEKQWRAVLENHKTEDGYFPNRGVAQFAEFLAMVKFEVGDPITRMEAYYKDVVAARKAYEDLTTSLATEIERGIKSRTEERDNLRIRRKRRGFPQFKHGKYNRLEIDKAAWTAGRRKPTVLIEINFHLRPHLGPGEAKYRPSVAINLDIRGGSKLRRTLREGFNERVSPNRYRPHGFGEPHTNSKWHFLSREVLLDTTETPVSNILAAFDVLYGFESELDEITQLTQA